ncbi:MAG: mechanosensitive ion channel, partial [Phycisphaerae bacterium]|nr:mechanosensitive ion channel [Phycisphaerae bacterium]
EAERIRRESQGKHPVLRRLAEQNAKLSLDLAALQPRVDEADRNFKAIETQLKHIADDFEATKTRLKRIGLSDTLATFLRNQRQALPRVDQLQRGSRERNKRLLEAELSRIEIDDRLRLLAGNRDKALDQELTNKDGTPLSAGERERVQPEAIELLARQNAVLVDLSNAYRRYINTIGRAELKQADLTQQVRAYGAYLDETLLWIRSAPPIGVQTLRDSTSSSAWLASPTRWAAAVRRLGTEALNRALVSALSIMLFAGLLLIRPRLRSRESLIRDRVHSIYGDRFSLTIEAIWIALLRALPASLLLMLAGWLLAGSAEATEFTKAIGAGLGASAWVFLALQLVREICRKHGLAEEHFRWSEAAIRTLRKHTLWLLYVMLPVAFISTVAWSQADQVHRHGLGRIAFMVGNLAIAYYIARILAPGGDVLGPFLQKQSDSWLNRLRYIWFGIAVGTPVALAVLSGAGYGYAAWRLRELFIGTIWLVAAAVLVHALVLRWLQVVQSQLAVQHARQKRAAAAKASSDEESEAATSAEEATIDIASVSGQSRQLLSMLITLSVLLGLWMIWIDVLPAGANVLERVELWNTSVVVDGEETLQPVTLTAIAMAIVLTIMAVVAAKNLPGLLEIALLQRLNLDAGTRYAVKTISQYVIAGVGLVMVTNALGVRWSQVQWLIAALGVGLGFGLQEIVANFMSGVIILFERPIRVGDTVTVGDVSGTVARIRIRATTITDWDNKELIVPNKTFITEQLVNWTLSDPITRLTIPVGIAYGSDTQLAHDLLMKVAHVDPVVIDEPDPGAYFLGFGDNSLNFELRVFVREMTNRARTRATHHIHMAIDKEFREHGITIAFPQRDLHLKSADVAIRVDARGRDQEAGKEGEV